MERAAQEIGDVGRREIAVYRGRDELDDAGEIRNRAERDELFGRSAEEVVLKRDPVDVAIYIILSVTTELNALLPAEALIARRDVDMQILRAVLIVHVEGHVEIDPAHHLDRGFDGAEVNDGAAVRLEARKRTDRAAQPLQSVAARRLCPGVDAVDFAHAPG